MAHTSQGSLAELIQVIQEDGGPSKSALLPQLCTIYEQMRAEKEQRDAPGPRRSTSSITVPVEDPAYAKLRHVLGEAYDQAAVGKGRDRHVKREDQPFEHQPICSLQRIYGSGYAFGQVGKKMEESMRMDTKAAVAELYGAINYIAAAIIVLEEGE